MDAVVVVPGNTPKVKSRTGTTAAAQGSTNAAYAASEPGKPGSAAQRTSEGVALLTQGL